LQRVNISSGGDISFYEDTGSSPKFLWDSSLEMAIIGDLNTTAFGGGLVVATPTGSHITVADSVSGERLHLAGSGGSTTVGSKSNHDLQFITNDTLAVTIDTSQNLLVGTTVSSGSNAPHNTNSATYEGFVLGESGSLLVGSALEPVGQLNAIGYNGDILRFRKDGTTVGSIGSRSGVASYYIIDPRGSGVGFTGTTTAIYPCYDGGGGADNVYDWGFSSARWDDIYATNGTIQTSDQNEKNTITDSDLGIDFIKRLTPKSYIFNGKTRTHYGLIAQDVETVLGDISKPTSGFAGFIKDDISEEQDGSEYRYGLRYTEFVAPLIQAVKDQQATIDALTARITALENGV
jgi:hypothetical protein